MFEKMFKLSDNHTTVRTEVMAGITTFMTMAYILAVNPSVLGSTGMDPDRRPAGDRAGLLSRHGLHGVHGKPAVCAVRRHGPERLHGVHRRRRLRLQLAGRAARGLYRGPGLRRAVADQRARSHLQRHPADAQKGRFGRHRPVHRISSACRTPGLSVDSSTLVTITSFTDNFHTAGICALLALVGLFITAVLYIHHVKGAILFGILATWIIGMLCQLTGLYVPDVEAGFYTLFPTFGMTDFTKFGLTFGQCFNVDFGTVGIINFIVVIFSFLFVDIFDTLGTLIGVATKAKMLDKDGKLPRIKPALLSDAIATSAGAILGTSTTTTFVESASGVAVGGRTGLTALVTGVLFLISTLFAPIFTAIPSFATAPALIMVGFLMVGTVSEIRFDLDNLTEAIPAYLAIISMPLFYSISEGISMGVISYVLLNLAAGKGKKVTPLMYVLAVLFILKYIFL